MQSKNSVVRPFPVTYPTARFANQFMFFAWDIFLNTDRWEKRKAIEGPTIAKVIQASTASEAGKEFERYKKWPCLLSTEKNPQFLFARNRFPEKGGFSRNELVAVLDIHRYASPEDEIRPDYHRIFPSEETFRQKANNRKKLRETILADVGQVMMVYADPENQLNRLLEQKLDLARHLIKECEYFPGYRYDLFGFSDPALLRDIEAYFENKIFTVGDGNHRTRAAKRTAIELPHIPTARWLMAALVNLYDPNFRIDPIHRLVRHRSSDFIATFSSMATLSKFDTFEELWQTFDRSENPYAIAAYDGWHSYLLQPYDCILEELQREFGTLVPVHVLNRFLKIHNITREHPDLDTEIEPRDAQHAAQKEPGTVAFFLKPIPRRVLEEAFKNHLIFPEKAFSIVGKVPAGGPMWLFGEHSQLPE